ncbi:MAG: hypothetical protein KC933_28245 [Myxococcales bacterium]|nr:hypothetical protein [Myxococcales bacterium]
MSILNNVWFLVIPVLAAVAAVASWIAQRYQKVGPNEVLIVSGRRTVYADPDTGANVTKNFRIFHGGGTFVVPIREKTHRMSVELMTLEIQTPEFFTKLGVPIRVDAIAQIKVRSDDAIATATAAEMFLSKSADQMNEIAHQMMQGHLRGVISTMPFETIHANPEAFAQSVQRLTAAELANMGIQVVSFTIRAVQDPSGYLSALGRPQMAQIQRDAVLGESASHRDATVGRAQAEREAKVASSRAHQESELARIESELTVAGAAKTQRVRNEEYEAEVARAKADNAVAYELRQATLQGALVTERLGVSKVERQLQIEVEDLEIARIERELVHTVRKPAEAERFRIEAIAEAKRHELELAGEARAKAARLEGLAEAEVIRAKALAEAEGTRQRELAEAEGLRARGLAEAEAMKQKAEAWRSYGEAAVAELFIEQLPAIAGAIAAPLAKIDRITLVGSNGSPGIERVSQAVTDVLAQVPGVTSLMQSLHLDHLAQHLAGGPTVDVGPKGDDAEPRPAGGNGAEVVKQVG